jgi:hypothetical protein
MQIFRNKQEYISFIILFSIETQYFILKLKIQQLRFKPYNTICGKIHSLYVSRFKPNSEPQF